MFHTSVHSSQILFDQAQRSIKQQLHTFIKESVSNQRLAVNICVESRYLTFFYPVFRDIRKFKDTKKQFDRVREDMELAQVKNAQAPRNKAHEAEEATQALILSRKAFRHLALDYVLQVKCTSPFFKKKSPIGGADDIQQHLSSGNIKTQFYPTSFGKIYNWIGKNKNNK